MLMSWFATMFLIVCKHLAPSNMPFESWRIVPFVCWSTQFCSNEVTNWILSPRLQNFNGDPFVIDGELWNVPIGQKWLWLVFECWKIACAILEESWLLLGSHKYSYLGWGHLAELKSCVRISDRKLYPDQKQLYLQLTWKKLWILIENHDTVC